MSSPRKALRDLSLRLYVVFPNETAKLQARKTLRLNHTEDASSSARYGCRKLASVETTSASNDFSKPQRFQSHRDSRVRISRIQLKKPLHNVVQRPTWDEESCSLCSSNANFGIPLTSGPLKPPRWWTLNTARLTPSAHLV